MIGMVKFFKILNRNIPMVAIIMLLLQSILPNLAAADILKSNQLAAANGLIAICSGFEIKYVEIDENGQARIVNTADLPENIPLAFAHCDNCILSDASILPSNIAITLPAKSHSAIQITSNSPVVLGHSANLPPARAPPYI